MKVFIRQNATTKTGYELVSIDELGNENVQPIEKTVLEKKTSINWLVLPENAANRKLINPAKLEKAGGYLELTYKESVVIGPRGENGEPRKKLEEYLTDEERDTLETAREALRQLEKEMLGIAKGRRDEERSKPLTEKEKLQRQLAKLQEKLAKYEKEGE